MSVHDKFAMELAGENVPLKRDCTAAKEKLLRRLDEFTRELGEEVLLDCE
jgi:hypothetical protein